MHRIISTTLIFSFLITPGCTSQRVAKVATFKPIEDASVVALAPRTGTYSLRFTADKKKVKAPMYASADRFMIKGEPLGFSMNEDGLLVAISGDERIPISAMPAGATHVMWYHKSSQPTQFSKTMNKVAAATAIVAGTSLIAVGVGASILLLPYADDCDSPDVEYQRPVSKNHRHRH